MALQQDRMDRLTRDVGKKAPAACAHSSGSGPPGDGASGEEATESPPVKCPEPPQVVSRDVVATLRRSRDFGPMLATRAWELGFFGACRKAYVGNGGSWIWTIFEGHCRPYAFVPILDFIHALRSLQNQQSRMNYPKYRREGLPMTSSHIESTNKQLNHGVKGTDKFWSRRGAEAMLQLKADTLSDTAPLDQFWRNRPERMNGCRHYSRSTA